MWLSFALLVITVTFWCMQQTCMEHVSGTRINTYHSWLQLAEFGKYNICIWVYSLNFSYTSFFMFSYIFSVLYTKYFISGRILLHSLSSLDLVTWVKVQPTIFFAALFLMSKAWQHNMIFYISFCLSQVLMQFEFETNSLNCPWLWKQTNDSLLCC